MSTSDQKLTNIMVLVSNYGTFDGSHHKQWVLDQVLRIALGDKYNAYIKEQTKPVWNEETLEWETYGWDTGCPP
jgi:hypothetical protein